MAFMKQDDIQRLCQELNDAGYTAEITYGRVVVSPKVSREQSNNARGSHRPSRAQKASSGAPSSGRMRMTSFFCLYEIVMVATLLSGHGGYAGHEQREDSVAKLRSGPPNPFVYPNLLVEGVKHLAYRSLGFKWRQRDWHGSQGVHTEARYGSACSVPLHPVLDTRVAHVVIQIGGVDSVAGA